MDHCLQTTKRIITDIVDYYMKQNNTVKFVVASITGIGCIIVLKKQINGYKRIIDHKRANGDEKWGTFWNKLQFIVARTLFYPSLIYGFILYVATPKRKWWNRINSNIVLGGVPFSFAVSKLHNEGVRAVINLCEEYSGATIQYSHYGIVQLNLPTIDYTAPSLYDIETGITFIDKYASQNQSVYVHCKAGAGRSPTLVLCYLLSKGYTRESAQKFIKDIRTQVNGKIYQRPVVLEYENKHKRR